MSEHPRTGRPVFSTSGKQFEATYVVPGPVATEPTLHISQEACPLCEADFLRIKHAGSRVSAWANGVLLAGFGLLLAPIGKFIQAKVTNTVVPIQSWEWIAPGVAVSLGALIALAARLLPNERKQLLKAIEAHFASAPRTRHIGDPRQ